MAAFFSNLTPLFRKPSCAKNFQAPIFEHELETLPLSKAGFHTKGSSYWCVNGLVVFRKIRKECSSKSKSFEDLTFTFNMQVSVESPVLGIFPQYSSIKSV